MKYKAKIKNKKCQCKGCDEAFLSADSKSHYCSACVDSPPFCQCGCGEQVKHPSKLYLVGHGSRGKTHEQIYKGKTPVGVGFQNGEANIAKGKEVRLLISASVKRSYTPKLIEVRRLQMSKMIKERGVMGFQKRRVNSVGKKFRSSLEVEFSEILAKNKLSYEYEKHFDLVNGRLKIVDFVVGDVLVEVTGYAYQKWKNDFDTKIKLLRASTDLPILVVGYDSDIEQLTNQNNDLSMCFVGIKNESRIVKSLQFLNNLQKFNKYVDDKQAI